MKRIKLLIVDSHPAVREGVKAILLPHEEFEIVGEASNGQEALLAIPRLQPDVVLMEVMMPRLGGIEATKAIKGLWPSMGVVLMSDVNTVALVQRALLAGANGYLTKDVSPGLLINTVKIAADGYFVMPGRLWQKLLPTFPQWG